MMNLLRSIAKSIPVIVVLLIVIELVWSNTLVGSGRDVRSIDLSIAQIRRENEVLAQQVASASALTTISVHAKEMGFVAPAKSQFVMIGGAELPVAIARPQ